MYTIKQLARLSGVTTRALRYYDEISLLKPSSYSDAGYRLYDEKAVDRLQQILFFRALNFPLEKIKKILGAPDFDKIAEMTKHYQLLEEKQKQLAHLLDTLGKTIQYYKGEKQMTDTEKFQGFKERLVEENETQFGEEIREKYGETTVEKANQKMLNLSAADFENMQATEAKLFTKLTAYAQQSATVDSALAKEIFTLHKAWLTFSWTNYQPQAHIGLAEMYVTDPRFTAYYDEKVAKGATQNLHDIILYYAK